MENAVAGHPGVLEAAVVARPDDVCDEVPAVLVVRRNPPDQPVEPQDIIDLLARKFARWQLPLPEDIHFVESLPKTGVGKLDKKVMRKPLAGFETGREEIRGAVFDSTPRSWPRSRLKALQAGSHAPGPDAPNVRRSHQKTPATAE